jgi:hypothetical protein
MHVDIYPSLDNYDSEQLLGITIDMLRVCSFLSMDREVHQITRPKFPIPKSFFDYLIPCKTSHLFYSTFARESCTETTKWYFPCLTKPPVANIKKV